MVRGDDIHRGLVIVNELAPGAQRARWAEQLAAEMPGYELSEVRVSGFEQARDAARNAAGEGYALVVAVGGDGTINACANGIGDAPTRLAVMPAGTANDLARLLGQPRDPARDVEEISHWTRREIDALTVEGSRFYSAGGLGWVADVAALANDWRSRGRLRRWLFTRLGSFIYTLACLVVLATRRRLRRTFEISYTEPDGATHVETVTGYGLLVANCDQLGASFHLVPTSRVDDGMFEIILFGDMSRWQLLRGVLAARRGKLFDVPGVRYERIVAAHVTTDAPIGFFGDGEVLVRGDDFSIGLEPAAFKLLAPVAVETRPALAPAPRCAPTS